MNINIDRLNCAYGITLHVETEVDVLYLADALTEAEYNEAIKRLHSAHNALMGVRGILKKAAERTE